MSSKGTAYHCQTYKCLERQKCKNCQRTSKINKKPTDNKRYDGNAFCGQPRLQDKLGPTHEKARCLCKRYVPLQIKKRKLKKKKNLLTLNGLNER